MGKVKRDTSITNGLNILVFPQGDILPEWRKYLHPDDLLRVTGRWTRALKERVPYESEYRLRGKDGTYRWFLSRGIPIRNKENQVIKWMGTATDIHQNKEALMLRDDLLGQLDQEIEARKIQQAELERAVKTRDEFMSMASHELKTPLTSLQLQTQMTKKIINKEGPAGFPPEKLAKLVQTFDNQVNRLGRLVEDMLDVSRINLGILPINLEIFDVAQLATEVVERFNTHSDKPGGHGITISAETVYGNLDQFRIEQIILNLLSNAIKYGGGSPVHVRVFEEDKLAKIIVTDRGPGIALENQKRIFRPFERATSPRQVSGLGLGLHIVDRIVSAHAGTISVHSELGKGSSFIVELPSCTRVPVPLHSVEQTECSL